MSSLTINVNSLIKQGAFERAKAEGLTLTFVITQALKAYRDGKIEFGVLAESDHSFRDPLTSSLQLLDKILDRLDLSKIPSAREQLKDL